MTERREASPELPRVPTLFVVAVAIVLFGTACRHATCPAQLVRDPAAVLASQHARAERVKSLRAEAKIDQRGRKGRIKGRVLMFVERPDRVRFDAMTQFGPALVLTSDGSSLALSDFKENRYFTGAACAENIARLVGVALDGDEVASVLLGDSPLLEAGSDMLRCSGEGSYVMERRAASGERQELEFEIHPDDFDAPPQEQRLTLARVSVWNARGARLYRVRYEDYKTVGAGAARLPFTVRIDDFENDSDAILRFQSIDVNVRVPAEAFHQEPRAGLAVESLSCE